MAKGYLVLFAFLWFCINRFMRTRGQTLQAAYRKHIEPLGEHVQFAVNLTLKESATICTPYANGYGVYKRKEKLDEDKLVSSIRYFNALLTRSLFGNKARHPNKQDWAKPLAVYSVEGRNTVKRLHIHAAVGNVPEQHREIFPLLAKSAWQRCDFSHRDMKIVEVYDAAGWYEYITKQIGYTDNDCLDIVNSVIPPFIKQRICT